MPELIGSYIKKEKSHKHANRISYSLATVLYKKSECFLK